MPNKKTLSISAILACVIFAQCVAADRVVFPIGNEDDCSSVYTARPVIGTVDAKSIKPLTLQPGPHLFIDDYLIAQTKNVVRRVNQLQRDPMIPNPIITSKDGDRCVGPFVTVLHDPDTKLFRIWYQGFTDGTTGKYATMTSRDGVHWDRPAKLLKDPGPIKWGCSVIDEGASFADPSKRYKLAWVARAKALKNEKTPVGLMLATSRDGLNWNQMTPEPVVLHARDINSLFYDPIRKQYLYTFGTNLEDKTKWDGLRRASMQMTSTDLKNWSKPNYVLSPLPQVDFGDTQFYGLEGYLVRGDLIIATVKVLRDELVAKDAEKGSFGVGYSTLAWSRDGKQWVRDANVFLEPDPNAGTWDHAHAWIDEQVLVDDEVLLYYGGYRNGHKMNRTTDRQIGLVKMRRDRYVARAAEKETGTLRTMPLILEGISITVNADVKGSLSARLLDTDGKAIPGFDFADCEALYSDSLDHKLKWKNGGKSWEAKPMQIEFQMTSADLFGFTLSGSL